jgi:hypothetical protein
MISYQERIFAFIDILGFADLVKESEFDTSKIIRIYNLLERTKTMARLPVGHKFKYIQVDWAKFRSHTFSDSIIISCPYESFDYFNALIGWIMAYQHSMWAQEGTFIRGAVVYGKIFDEENSAMLFGPALVDAYHLEKDTAKWPRILVDSSIWKKFSDEERLRTIKECLVKDNEGNYYLDHLRELFVLNCSDKGDPIVLFQNHRTAIERAVEHIRIMYQGNSEKKKKLLDKYSCLSKYHNSVVDQLCEVALQLQSNNVLVRSIISELTIEALIHEQGQQYDIKPEFTAENLEYVDILPILGIAFKQLTNAHPANEQIESIDLLCDELPKYLGEFQRTFAATKINAENLSSDESFD